MTNNDLRLYKWVHGSHEGFEVVGCMFLQPPFDGVVVQFGEEVQVYEHGFEYQWRVLDNPNGLELTSENTEFTKYLQRVITDRLSEGGINELEGKTSTDSGTD